MVNVASYYLALLLVHFFKGAQDLYTEVLVPLHWFLWQGILVLGNSVLFSLPILFHHLYKSIRRLMRYLRQQPGKALFKGIQWTYYGLVIFYQRNAYKVILRAIQYQLLFTLAMNCLDWMWMVVTEAGKRGLQLLKQDESQMAEDSSAILNLGVFTSALHPSRVPLSQRFPGPNISILQKFISNFKILLVHINIKEGIRYCFLGTSKSRGTRIQHKEKEKKSLLFPSREDIIHQIKSTLVTFFLFYIYNTFLFVQVIK